MNLFWLDTDPVLAAQAHQDIHVGKMLLEAVQLLCTAFLLPWEAAASGSWEELPWEAAASGSWEERRYLARSPAERLVFDQLPYAHTHTRHPCAVWARASRGNFDAAIALAQALAVEYRYRFDKPHGSEVALDWVVRHQADAKVPDGPLQPFVLAMPEEYREQDTKYLIEVATGTVLDPCVAAYRAYYRAEKRGYWRKSRDPAKPSTWVPAKWTKRDPPEWF